MPTLLLDACGHLKHLTPAARRLLGYTEDHRIEPYFFAHVHAKNLYRVMRDLEEMICYNKLKAEWVLRLRRREGTWQWCRATVHNHLQRPAATIDITLHPL